MNLFLLLLPLAAEEALVLEGHRYPQELEAHGETWNLQGAKHHVYKVFSVFTGGLYKQEGGEGLRLSFSYTRKLKAKILRREARKVLVWNFGEEGIAAKQPLFDELQAVFDDVEKNDTYVFTIVPDKGFWLERDGEQVFFSPDAEFGFWYVNIWLGEAPMSISFRDALLNEGNP